MSFFDYLEKLRELPESTRQKILLLSSIALTLFITVAWFSSFRLEPLQGGEDIKREETQASQPLNFFESVRGVVSDVAHGFGVIRNRVKSEFEKL